MQPKDRRLVTEKNLEEHTETAVGSVRGISETAHNVSSEAISVAHTANQNSANAVTRVEHVETLAGLAPGDVTDSQTANLLQQADSSTRAAFGDAMAAEINTDGTSGLAAIDSRIEQRAVTGVGVTKIIASLDPLYPLEPGELLVLLHDPRPQFFTDFSEYPTRAGAPQGWSQHWNATELWELQDDSTIEGGKYLRNRSLQPGSRRLLVWDDTLDAAALYQDQEIVFKWRADRLGALPRGVIRAHGASGAETAYWSGHNGANASTGTYVDGAVNTLGTNLSLELNTWYITRMRVEGDNLKARTWPAHQQEPTTWTTDVTDESIPETGNVGVLAAGGGMADFAFFGVGYGGARAPMGAVS